MSSIVEASTNTPQVTARAQCEERAQAICKGPYQLEQLRPLAWTKAGAGWRRTGSFRLTCGAATTEAVAKNPVPATETAPAPNSNAAGAPPVGPLGDPNDIPDFDDQGNPIQPGQSSQP